MYHTEENEKSKIILQKITDFLASKKMIIMSVLAGLIVLVLVIFIYDKYNKDVMEKSARDLEKMEELYAGWQKETGLEARMRMEEELTAGLDSLIKKYPGYYAGQKSLFLKAEIFYAKGDFESANSNYALLAGKYSKGHLVEASLFFSGICLENLGRMDEAITQYNKLVAKHKDSIYAPNALFSLGRLYEGKEDYEKALAMYQKLRSDYSFSDWTKLGVNRIIYLQNNKLNENM